MINRILQYINQHDQYATEDRGVITIFRGLAPGLCVVPYLNKYWTSGNQFPYPTVRVYGKQLPSVVIPTDVWHVRADTHRAIVVPDSSIYTGKYLVDADTYEVPTEELTYIDLTSEEEMLHNWEDEQGELRKKARKPRKVRSSK